MDVEKVLFFGQTGCDRSIRALKFLEILGYKVTPFFSSVRGEKIPDDILNWKGDFIFSFRCYVILPETLIESAAKAAINFHPATPDFPGSGCANHALFENKEEYGITAHLMNGKVDNGGILRIFRFPIFPSDNIESLLERTHHFALTFFYEVVTMVKDNPDVIEDWRKRNEKISWNGKARRISEIDSLSILTPNAPKNEVDAKVRAFHTKKYPLKLHLDGYEFLLCHN